jgi:hypothetical protein
MFHVEQKSPCWEYQQGLFIQMPETLRHPPDLSTGDKGVIRQPHKNHINQLLTKCNGRNYWHD